MKHFRLALLFAVPFLTTTAVWGAGGELAGFGGGIDMDGGVGTHSIYGSTAAVKLDKVHIFGEFSWAQLASVSQHSSGVSATGSADLANFGGGVDYSFGSSKRVVPYVLTAFGVGHFYAKGSGSGNGTSVSVSIPIANSAYVGVGGGVRIYIGKSWGIKPEFRYQRYFSSTLGDNNAAVFTGGLFWQFGN